MILKTRGKSINISKDVVGAVTFDPGNFGESKILIDQDGLNIDSYHQFDAVMTSIDMDEKLNGPVHASIVYKVPAFDHLEEGDIVALSPSGKVFTMYRINSNHNSLLVTERCNSNCLMCSQPPRDRDDIEVLFNIHSKVVPLIPKDCQELGITGGEPTLMGNYFFDLLKLITKELPDTEIHVLTNGRTFAWHNMAERLAEINNPRIMLGIPLYSDYYQIHDYVVQAENAFYQTVLGIQNLERYNKRVEIRVVLHKQTIPRLKKLSEYIYRNMPYVEHVAFMGLEYIGYTPHNIDKLWIDPYDYRDILTESVNYLHKKGMHVSIYNTPLCVLPNEAWDFARKSISDWKNDYLPECQSCAKIEECGGLFTWNLKKHSNHIQPFN